MCDDNNVSSYNVKMVLNNKDLISILRGLRNGIYYGGKVRLVHSFVMMLLFKSISKSEIKNIARLGF